MKEKFIGILLLSIFIVSCEPKKSPPPATSSPAISLDSFPERYWIPNEQEAASWKGPYNSILRKMFEAGLPDPMGLPYHKVSIQVGNCYTGDSGFCETQAWLLPAKETKNRFVIAWNGLIYPLVKDHGVANLESDIKKVLSGNVEGFGFFGREENSLIFNGKIGIQQLYLTRFNLFDQKFTLEEEGEPVLKNDESFAWDWLWYQYERAVTAHMRGDLQMCIESARVFLQHLDSMKAIAYSSSYFAEMIDHWAKDIEPLIKESEHRAATKKTGILDVEKFLASNPSVPELIDALDRIQIPQPGQPDYPPLWESRIVKALVNKGNEAIEPLLDCLRHDSRLTQSVYYWREIARQRTILGVHEAALYALQDSLQIDLLQLGFTGGSLSYREPKELLELANGLLAHWEKSGRLSGHEINYKILMDDAAGAESWSRAAIVLVHSLVEEIDTERLYMPSGPLPGEVLRAKSNPSVSDLLEKRIAETKVSIEKADEENFNNYLKLLTALANWEPQKAKKLILAEIPSWSEIDSWHTNQSYNFETMILSINHNIPEILTLFEAMVWKIDSDKFDDGIMFVTDVIAKNSKNSILNRPLDEIWMNPNSPWSLKTMDFDKLEEILWRWQDYNLILTEPFRKVIFESLSDASICACTKYSFEIRRMDVVAYAISSSFYEDHIDSFDYTWPLKDRDNRIKELITKLNTIEEKK